ncbi:MAG TPA: DUF523 and DUF1722 domain-containing protein [candidate division Zixibacteria bacterium]|nr:DUF523 and DUF1722 domain-containing protein [candidate division Zixibacteria bacterium]
MSANPVSHPKPIIVVSKCLEFDACRYNGARLDDTFVRALRAHVKFAPVCPEVEIGLGVPRDPVRLLALGGVKRMVQPASGDDVTDKMNDFSQSYLQSLEAVDGFILKSKSPSCGIRDTKQYASLENSMSIGRDSGLFAQSVLARHPHLAVEDEARLSNYTIRERFLTRVFASARLRQISRRGAMKDLVRFHAENKYLLLTYSQRLMRTLGRIVANAERAPLPEVFAAYAAGFHESLSHTPRHTSHINTLQHGFGYVSDRLNGREKRLFSQTIAHYQDKRVPLGAVIALLRAWILRFDVEYLERQTYFEPYPAELLSVQDSGKGRAL